MSRLVLGLAAAASLALTATRAEALQQPDGTVIPTTAFLQNMFNGRGETINALNDAVTLPETFTPSCALTFEVVARNAGFDNSFGWYNVTGQKPANAELYEFLACSDDVGTVKALDIRNDPRYTGGDIGFYQAAGGGCPTPSSHDNIFYSEKGYNPDGNQANPYIHLLTYNSTATANAFYFGWEDLLTGNDNDFDDLVTFVTGITCTGGGEPCDTGQQGVCAQGVLQCQNGALVCVAQVMPQTESCDGFDNDCNDIIDEGDLCDVGYVCDRGTCVPGCGSAEFPCPPGKVCTAELVCVDAACADVHCETGKKCVDGTCVGPCENVVCPHGEVCQLGVCLDPCGPVTCDANQVCVLGVCVDRCQCKGCDAAEACEADGKCVPTACAGVMCPANQHCDATGACVDDCVGASCPLGQKCEMGACIDDTTGEGGAGGGPSAATGLASTVVGAGGAPSGSSASTGSGAGGDGNGIVEVKSCSCTVGDGEGGGRLAFVAIAAAALIGLRRRSRTR